MYEAKKFDIPELDGISAQTIEEHLKLYEGYVKHVNKITELMMNPQDHDEYALKEARRRLAFEFDGMRNHEYYFDSLVGGSKPLPDSPFKAKLEEQYNGADEYFENFKKYLATTRGIGWAILGYDTHRDILVSYWVDEQHLGHLTGVQPIVMLDMWEHSYCLDYPPSEKSKYVDAYFSNLNWETIATYYDYVAKKN